MKINAKEGLVRRVDDLGRIVIPKEMRQSMGISEGDPMSIMLKEFEDGMAVVISKYKTIMNPADLKACLDNIAQFMPDNILLGAIPKWESHITRGGSIPTGQPFAEDDITPNDISKTFIDFELRFVADKEPRHTHKTIPVSLGKRKLFFTGKRIECMNGQDVLLIGAFHQKEVLDELYLQNLLIGIDVFAGKSGGVV